MFTNVDDELRLFVDSKLMPTATPVAWEFRDYQGVDS